MRDGIVYWNPGHKSVPIDLGLKSLESSSTDRTRWSAELLLSCHESSCPDDCGSAASAAMATTDRDLTLSSRQIVL